MRTLSRRAEITISLALFAAAWALLEVVFGSFDGLARAMDISPHAFGDFRHIYLVEGRRILESTEPARGFFYTPFFALLMVPLAGLPESMALALWAGLQVASVAGLALLAPRVGTDPTPGLRLGAIALTLLSLPVAHGLSWGQVSGLVVACLLGSAVSWRRGWRIAAGALIGLTIAVKYYTAGALVAFLGTRARRVAIVAVVGSLVLALGLPMIVLGAEGTASFYGGVLRLVGEREAIVRQDPNSQYVANVVSRWLGADPDRGEALHGVGRALGLVLAAGLALLAIRRARGGDARGVRDGLVLAFLATPFWVPTSWPHYFVYLPYCQLVLGDVAWRGAVAGARRRSIGALVAVSIAVSSTPFFLAAGGHVPYAASGALLIADSLLATAALVAWLPRGASQAA